MRNLKALGLALVAALALTAASASAAMAAEFHSEGEETKISATQVGLNEFETSAGATECEITKYEGEISGSTTSPEIETTPTYEECTTAGQETDITVTPPAIIIIKANHVIIVGSNIHITVTSGGKSVCTITVGEQEIEEGASFSNIGSGSTREMEINSEATGIEYSVTGGSGKCGTEGSHSDGEYRGSVRATGSMGGTHTGIWWE